MIKNNNKKLFKKCKKCSAWSRLDCTRNPYTERSLDEMDVLKNKIKEALNHFLNEVSCEDCSYYKELSNSIESTVNLIIDTLLDDTSNLINEYDKEIKRLKAENEKHNVSKILGNEVTYEFHDDVVSGQPVDRKDIEKYTKPLRNRIISINETIKKQAKIDVLSELRTYCVERENYKGIQQQQNEDLLRINDERKFHPELTLDEIFAIRSGADKANGQSTMANKVVEKIDRMIEELKK